MAQRRPLRTALVTGASAGIGRELVRLLVRDRGMTVLATARRRDRLESLRDELPTGQVEILDGDLGEAGFRARLWEAAEALPGGCDLLVNNAGLGFYSAFAEQDPARIRQMVEINVMALFDLTQRAARAMSARGHGQIVEVSSVLGELAMPYSAVYTATKHAVNGLVKALRYELRGTGVRVWAACPGRTESEFQGVALGKTGEALATHRRFGSAEPTARVARGILRGLDRRAGFIEPTWLAWGLVRVGRWLPGPLDWAMGRWAPAYFRREMESG
jgi:short-subunit dehydrogenase